MLDQLQSVFASFQKNDVKYLVIGGIAAVLYGVPRATFDLHVLIAPTTDNAERLLRAMTEAQLGTASLTTVEALISTEITIFTDRVRLDVLTSAPGIIFEQAWERRELQRPSIRGCLLERPNRCKAGLGTRDRYGRCSHPGIKGLNPRGLT